MKALNNSQEQSQWVPAPQVGALALRPYDPQYNMIKMPSGNRMLFKRVDTEPKEQPLFGFGARLRRAFGQTPLAVFKAVKLRPATYKPEAEVNFEANAVANSMRV